MFVLFNNRLHIAEKIANIDEFRRKKRFLFV